jgi:phosphohistidine swiveling domain-containing protein
MTTTTMTEHPDPGKPIPTPPDFPVAWEKPGDVSLYWERNLFHYPDPMTPLEFEFGVKTFNIDGLNHAAEVYDFPIRFDGRRINGYVYQAIIPVGAPPEAVVKGMNQLDRLVPGLVDAIQNTAVGAQTRRYLKKMDPAIARIGEYWNNELLPEVKKHLSYWESFDLRGATMPELLAHLEETEAKARRLGEIHFLIDFPFLMAPSMFEDLYRELFGEENGLEAYRLLQGFDNKTLEADRVLWQLSRAALARPTVRRVLQERAAADVVPELEQSVEGRAFLTDLHAYLDEYGQRSDKFDTIGAVSWIEDPTPAIKSLKDYVTQHGRNPEAELAALAAEREWLVSKARERLKGYPRPVLDRFESLLKSAQEATVISEDHVFWIDYQGLYRIRRVLQEFGRRFAEAGMIEEKNDVLQLTSDELRETAGALPGLDRHGLVRKRKAALERFRAIRPPRAIGTMPLGEPPDEPIGRAIGRFFGKAPEPQGEPNVLRGNAGSPGTVRGRAKVIRSLSEADKLQEGDVLVAETTAPPWTPLFATAAAVVTDTGGVLSHCAVVAREYRIPAVVGIGTATAAIQDGQLLEVNCSDGVVRIVS